MPSDVAPGPIGAALSRRDAMRVSAVAAASLIVPASLQPALATPEAMQAVVAKVTGGATLLPDRVKLIIPELVENGNSVPVTVAVESPMTPTDYVKAIHIFNEKNPQPNVITCHLGPRAGYAVISTRIRLSDTQDVLAIAEMSDGSFLSDKVNVIVTLGACLEDPI